MRKANDIVIRLPIALAIGAAVANGVRHALEIGEIDTAGLQLLILLKKEAQRAGKTISIVAHSQSVRAVIDFCKLAAELGDPLVIPAAEAS